MIKANNINYFLQPLLHVITVPSFSFSLFLLLLHFFKSHLSSNFPGSIAPPGDPATGLTQGLPQARGFGVQICR